MNTKFHIKRLIILIVNVLLLNSCDQNESEDIINQSYQRTSSDLLEIRECWINIDYLEYINKSFPKYSSVNIDIPVLLLNSLKYAQIECLNEYCLYDIQNNGEEYYFTTYDSIDYSIEIINNDTLKLNNEVFISNENWDNWGFDFVDKLKGDAFKVNYENELKKIFTSIDTIILTYNPYWQVYFLRNEKDCKDMYITEFNNDSVFVYDFPNKCEPLKKGWKKDIRLIGTW